MLLFLKLVGKTQMPQSQNFRTALKQILAAYFYLSEQIQKARFNMRHPGLHTEDSITSRYGETPYDGKY